jgi:hypothetical protein
VALLQLRPSSSVSGNFAMLDGATREDSMDMMREMQRAVDAVAARLEEEHGRNPLVYVLAEIGGNTGGGLSGADRRTRTFWAPSRSS